MELDTRASTSIVSENDCIKNFRSVKINSNSLRLHYYTSETVKTLVLR